MNGNQFCDLNALFPIGWKSKGLFSLCCFYLTDISCVSHVPGETKDAEAAPVVKKTIEIVKAVSLHVK
ncbi:unnamed protein product [Coregonus sp. 'balchen']|nr:unnamed protein product [Coregonus sp. 'balchen']